MSKIITTSDLNSVKFYQLPKAFFHNPVYMHMKNESKIAYAILRDLLELSIKNNWINKNNEVYVKLSRKKLMKHLNIKGTQKMTEIFKELVSKDLIIEKQVGVKQCNEIYVCIPDELTKIYSDEELLEYDRNEKDNPMTFENQNSRLLKIKTQDFRKSKLKTFENQTHTNTNITNTNITNSSSSSKTYINNLIPVFNDEICELRKTTSIKFLEYVNTYNSDFIKAIIEYCSEINIKSFAGFKKVIDSYIVKNILTREDLLKDIEKFRREKTRKKIKKTIANNNKKVDSFNNYDQRNYDFQKLEKALSGDKNITLEECTITEDATINNPALQDLKNLGLA